MENLVRIIIFGVLTGVLSLAFTPIYIRILNALKLSKQIREEASLGGGKAALFHKLHIHKRGTPTMGGGVVVVSVIAMVVLSMVLVAVGNKIGLDLSNSLWNRNETYLVIFTLVTIAALGGIDDYMNIRGIGKTKGMSARVKMFGLTFFALLGAGWFYYKLGYDSITLPAIGQLVIGWWYIPLFVFIIIAMTNSVNFTDGLDGLCGGLLIQNFFLYAFITYNESLFLLSTLCVVICGALIGFLWFNIKPAQFYMGDIGSLSLGATLGIMAMMTDTLMVLFVASLIYAWESISVIIQLTSKKLRNGKKVFKIAPYHHHLEAKHWPEETIVMRFWLLGGMLNALAMMVYVIK